MDQPSKEEITLLTLAGHIYYPCRPCIERVGHPGRWYSLPEKDNVHFVPWRELLYGNK